jgi:hypothetical protein
MTLTVPLASATLLGCGVGQRPRPDAGPFFLRAGPSGVGE